MNIVHITTYSRGGAFRSAQRLHKGLIKQGINSKILFLEGKILDQNYIKFHQVPKTPPERILKKLKLPNPIAISNHKKIKGLIGDFEKLSLPNTPYRVEDHPLLKWADVINLHWVSDFIDYSRFFKKIKKPIVWTLHDMNPFMGVFHYQNDFDNNEVYQSLDMSMRDYKRQCLKNSKIKIVAPSKWLKKESTHSLVFKGFQHYHIPYGINTEVFQRHEKSFSRKVLAIAKTKTVFLFVVDFLISKRKGGSLIVEAMERVIQNFENVIIMTVGNGNIESEVLKDHIVNLGSINDDRLMSIIYSASDALLLPSAEDNLPNVMIESLVCGTPVITNFTGGMKDVIISGINGLFARHHEATEFEEVISNFIKTQATFNNHEIIENAIQKFELNIQALNYIKLYNTLS